MISPQSVGGRRAGETGGRSSGSLRCVRIFRIGPGLVMNAISRISPPQFGRSPDGKDRSDVVIHYRNHCDIHGRRRCPLPAWGENVLSLSDVLSILTFYQASGERLSAYPWEDVSKYFLDDGLKRKGGLIREIRPHERRHEREE